MSAGARNYRVITPQNKKGKACAGGNDCFAGDDACPPTTTATTATATTVTATTVTATTATATTTTTVTTRTTTTTTLEALRATFLGVPVDVTNFACRTRAEQEAENAYCHPGGPVIWNVINNREIIGRWNEQDMAKHFKDDRGYSMKPSVQTKLEEMNQKLTGDFIAENIKREAAAWDRTS